MAITTIRDLLISALGKIQAYAPGEVPSDADLETALDEANLMLDSWSTEALTVFAYQEQSTVLTVGQIQYTIGTSGGADLNVARPIGILTGPGRAYVVDTNGNRYPVDVVTQDQWNLLWNITSTNASWPTTLFYDPQFPLGRINIYPQPNQGGMTLFWDSYLPLTAFASLFTALSFPPGYRLALRDCIARRLWRYFKSLDKAIPQDIVGDALAAKRNVKRINYQELVLYVDPALTARGGTYNVYADSVGAQR